jgi:trk system potassium uptake protein TrkH
MDRTFRFGSIHIIPLSFLAVILLGSLLLMLPSASAAGERTGYLTALFTATTSVCVTGLVVTDTFSHWSTFGHVVILLLIQAGGLGIITTVSMMMVVMRQKFSLGDRVLLQDALNLSSREGILSFLKKVVLGTLLVEGLGAFFYSFSFVPRYGLGRGIWFSVFHAVSAFCNAGLDIIGSSSLAGYSSDPFVLTVTMILIVMGGLGYVVWFDILTGAREKKRRGYTFRQAFARLSEHTRLVLVLTAFLIISGALFFLAAEWHNPQTMGSMSVPGKVLNSLFESVTLRTAGFSAFPQEGMREVSSLAAYAFMFIGGSPVGTAGGVKTVTVFLVLKGTLSYIRGSRDNTVFKRSVTLELMRKATAVVTVSFIAVCFFTVMLLAVQSSISMEDGLFEVVSALATVGLSRGLTASLNTAARIIIIICMYLGRIGPISMAIFFTGQKYSRRGIRYADGNFFVG